MAVRTRRFLLAVVSFLFSYTLECSASITSRIPTETTGRVYLGTNDSCWVEEIQGGKKVVCDVYDTLDTVRTTGTSDDVISLVIRNQPRLTHLSHSDFSAYPNLVNLSITNTGLTWLEHKTFSRNRRLRSVDLRSNALKTVDWRSVVNLGEATLAVNDNQLVCNCSLFWLAVWKTEMTQSHHFRSPDGTDFSLSSSESMTLPKDVLVDDLVCVDQHTEEPIHLSTWRRMNQLDQDQANICSLPSVDMVPKVVQVTKESTTKNVQFRCSIDSNQPLDTEFRRLVHVKVVDSKATQALMRVDKQLTYSGKSTVTVTLPNATAAQMGWYVCIGLSVSGPSFDMAALTVESKPRLTLISRNRTKSPDHFTDTFKFNIFAFPPLSNITWLKNDVPINFTDEVHKHVFMVINDAAEHLHRKGFFFAVRTIFIARLRYVHQFFEGDYSAVACNALGCGRLTFVTYDKHSLPKPALGVPAAGAGLISPTGKWSATPMADSTWIAAIICMSVGVCVCGVGASYYYVRYKRQRGWPVNGRPVWKHPLDDDSGRGPILEGNDRRRPTGSIELSSYTSNDAYEPLLSSMVPLVPGESIKIVKTLGEGAFGEVYLIHCKLTHSPDELKEKHRDSFPKIVLQSTQDDGDGVIMAAKALKSLSTDRSHEIAREAELMARLSHPNIVTFYGACLRGTDDLLLLFEYMELGDLKGFLASHGPHPELHGVAPEDSWILDHKQLIDISRQIADGLAYLHKYHFVHRDLACRNCLVKSPMIVKLSDFGMTRDIYSSDYYRLTHKAPLPVRWLPPESLLYGRFSELSDIWSYGVVVWEICSYGKVPWCEYSNMEVMQRINAGEMIEPPADCPTVLRQLMMDCWKRVPNERAKIDDIVNKLNRAMGESTLCE